MAEQNYKYFRFLKKNMFFISFFLLIFSAPVFAFQHSSCYIHDCTELTKGVFGDSALDKSSSEMPCHKSEESSSNGDCSYGGISCDVKTAGTVSDQEGNFSVSVLVLAKIIIKTPFLAPDVSRNEIDFDLHDIGEARGTSAPIYIITKTLLI